MTGSTVADLGITFLVIVAVAAVIWVVTDSESIDVSERRLKSGVGKKSFTLGEAMRILGFSITRTQDVLDSLVKIRHLDCTVPDGRKVFITSYRFPT